MRKCAAALCVLAVLVGCQTTPEIQTASQARERANYLKAEASGYEKQAAAAEKVIEGLRKELKEEQAFVRELEKRAKRAEQRLARLRARTPQDEGEKEAVRLLTQNAEAQVDGLYVKTGEREAIIARLKEQVAEWQHDKRASLNKARDVMQEAKQMEAMAEKLAAEKQREEALNEQN